MGQCILNKLTLTSVKGSAESVYRTGQINLTPANLGISATTSSVTVGSTTFNKYTHPTDPGNKHIPIGGSNGDFLKYNSSGTAAWTSLTKSDITDFPTNMAPTSHIHGNLSNDGKIGSTANYAIYTTTDGLLIAGNLETTDPSASGSGITYIASIAQDSKGKITATKSTVRNASTSQSGVISTAAQSFAGVKTFTNGITAGSSSATSSSDHNLWNSGITIHDTRYDSIEVTSLSKSANLFFSNKEMPTSNWWSGIHMAGWTGDYNAWELAGPNHNTDQRTTPLYIRSGRTTGGWGSWRKIYDTSNKPTASDIGLGNVKNQAITVTSTSVSDGTNTFNKYTHPTSAGNKHIPSGGSSGQFLKYSSDGTATWNSLTKSDISDFPTSMTPTSHTHGKITNAGDITTNVAIASGDRLVINDESASQLNNSSITFGTSTTTFLTNKGTWATPAGTFHGCDYSNVVESWDTGLTQAGATHNITHDGWLRCKKAGGHRTFSIDGKQIPRDSDTKNIYPVKSGQVFVSIPYYTPWGNEYDENEQFEIYGLK